MKKLSIIDFHRFIRGDFARRIRNAYQSHLIFCEADLQSFAWDAIRRFLRKNEEARGKFRVLNKPFLRDCTTYPDLVVFRRKKPWVVIELKEGKRLLKEQASRECKKLLHAKKILKPKRGYLVYAARYGGRSVLPGPKGLGAARFFFEVPIILMSKGRVDKAWITEFRRWSKYVIETQPKDKR